MSEDQYSAADTVIAGLVQRIGTANEHEMYAALQAVSSSVLVQVEFMMIFDAIQAAYKAGRPLDHDAIMEEIRAQEPDGDFGFACGVFESAWQGRAQFDVSASELDNAVDLLVRIRADREGEIKR